MTSQALLTPTNAPGPRGGLLFGGLREFSKDMLGTITKAREVYGDLIHFRFGPRDIFVGCHPQLAEEVLIEKKEIFGKLSGSNSQDSIAILLGNGLLASRGKYWQRQRRMMQPVFHHRRVSALASKMIDAGDKLLARWASLGKNRIKVDMAEEMTRVTLDVIAQTMFGTEVSNDTLIIRNSLDITTKYVFERVRNPFLPPLSWPTPKNRQFRESLGKFDEIIYKIINQRFQNPVPRDDLLDMLLSARDDETGETMDIKQLRDEVATIFAAGHETTAAALTWTWYLLSLHPEIMQKVQYEIDTVCKGQPPKANHVSNLVFTKNALDESMRLFPPGPLVVRAAYDDSSIGGFKIPIGSRVLISIFNIHRHPDYWGNPEKFDPRRFLPEFTKDRHRYAFIPFNIGQRKCIGSYFAYMEALLIIAQVLQKYDVELDPTAKIQAEAAVTLRPKGGIRMILTPKS